jgi:anaerobic selenocysteine-containing dehydrogenase
MGVDRARGDVLPDWRIFSELAGRLGRTDLQYADAAAVRASIRDEVRGFPIDHDRSPRRMPRVAPRVASGADGGEVAASGTPGRGRFLLVSEHSSNRHRGIDLAAVVEGLGELHLEEGLRMNPEDLARLGVASGTPVTVTVDGADAAAIDLVLAARSDPGCPPGAVYVTRPEAWGGMAGAAGQPALERLARLPLRPVWVRVRAGDRARRSRAGVAVTGAHSPRAGGGPKGGARDKQRGGRGQGR